VQRRLGIRAGETTTDGKFHLERVACFGACALAPVMVLDDKVYGNLTPEQALRLLDQVP
jgi:NADH:ubiquinone oxidoreductase subunit E